MKLADIGRMSGSGARADSKFEACSLLLLAKTGP